ncbi:MAG: sulfotransferase domain-containing protein [Kiloniellales bacterium]|nr:sulfotransferase domain-containing protein [Kiloniellales bacterium]
MSVERWLRGREEYRKLRLADCVFVSWGKSGRTWLRLMVSRFYQTRHGLTDSSFLEFDNLNAQNPDIPKIFFTHGNYLRDYTSRWDSLSDFYDKKTVLLVRDPRDVAVSQYFQWKYRMDPPKKELNAYPPHGDEVSIFDFVMNHDAGLRRIVEFCNLWAKELPKMSSVLVVRYEDMRKDPEAVLGEILAFMGTAGLSDEIKEAVSFAAFENMKTLEEKKLFRFSGNRLLPGDRGNPNSYKVRRAKVGGYRDYFDDAQVEALDRFVEENLAGIFGYTEASGTAQPEPLASDYAASEGVRSRT